LRRIHKATQARSSFGHDLGRRDHPIVCVTSSSGESVPSRCLPELSEERPQNILVAERSGYTLR